jgi:hypothetical protein
VQLGTVGAPSLQHITALTEACMDLWRVQCQGLSSQTLYLP